MKRCILFYLSVLVALMGCSTIEPETIEQKYDQAIQHMDTGSYSLAIPLFQGIIDENPGTQYAAYAYLKLGDANLLSGESKYDAAETNYRIFLNYASYSHLVPYVLSRLIELNYKRNTSSLFGEEYAYSRDPGHFNSIIMEYQRFYFLYPNSLYLSDAKEYMDKSIEALAEHEFLIGNWYFDHSLFTPAISRYSYVLSHYPNFNQKDKVVWQLIAAYKKNQQPEKADELERVYKLSYKTPSTSF
ncbi:MAG: outer membrane protein assembly factor BamD [Proteobacteria bacterium]|nr:outer membrane protein assembly factor BamD [Pseudomonadota bacterium]